MAILTKTDVTFNDLRLSRELQLDSTYKWYVDVGYFVETQEGERYNKNKRVELTGARKTSAINFLTDLYGLIKTDEGIT